MLWFGGVPKSAPAKAGTLQGHLRGTFGAHPEHTRSIEKMVVGIGPRAQSGIRTRGSCRVTGGPADKFWGQLAWSRHMAEFSLFPKAHTLHLVIEPHEVWHNKVEDPLGDSCLPRLPGTTASARNSWHQSVPQSYVASPTHPLAPQKPNLDGGPVGGREWRGGWAETTHGWRSCGGRGAPSVEAGNSGNRWGRLPRADLGRRFCCPWSPRAGLGRSLLRRQVPENYPNPSWLFRWLSILMNP